MVLFGFLPNIGEITDVGMAILGIYLGTIVLWALVDLVWPSFLAMILISMTGYISLPEYLSSGFGNSTVIFVFLTCVYTFFVSDSGISDYLIRNIVTRKVAAGKPWVISSLFIAAVYFVAALISQMAALLVGLEVFSNYARELGYEKGEKYPLLMMVGITFASFMGGSIWTFRTPDAILVGYIRAAGGNVPLVPYFVCSVFIGAGALTAYMLLCKYVFRPDVDRQRGKGIFEEVKQLTGCQKTILGMTYVLFALLVAESFLSGRTTVGKFLSSIGTSGIFLIFMVIMSFMRRKDKNEPLVDMVKGARAIPWQIIFLIVFNMPLAGILNDELLGINRSMQSIMTGVFGTNRFIFILIIMIMTIVATTFMGNVSVCLMFYNIAAVYASNLGISLNLLACIISIASNSSIALPSANPQAAMLHSKTEWVNTRGVAKYSIVLSVLVLATTVIAYVTLLPFLG